VDATGRANLDLLWNSLDRLPAGEQDLLGPALNAALEKLTAQPDPASSSDCGVQLMTIHKSKGLEFEVVIVPDLQAKGGNSHGKMLSWLERGLAEPDESGEITEFLIAPFQPKGEERGNAKAWVDRVYRQRESQETRRVLYVASTRAREELHFFARPAYKTETSGALSLTDPNNSLLATAWPALEDEVRARFADWKTTQAKAAVHGEQIIESIAATESNLLIMPPPLRPTVLRRLPPNYRPAPADALAQPQTEPSAEMLRAPSFPRPFAERVGNYDPQSATILLQPYPAGALGLASETWESMLYSRHEGGRISRSLGTAVHTLLEELARLRITLD
jgi:ATP-dependent exoDNAse (exonuclease V) beta subunit